MNPIRVLLVEDDPDITELLRASLGVEFECLRASNGLEGMQMALEGEPDLIVTDVMMPVMDGYEFVQRLRRTPEFETVPVIFLSALGSPDHIKKGYSFGAALYLTKPIDPTRFRRNIQLFIEDKGIVPRPKKRVVADVQKSLAHSTAMRRRAASGGETPTPSRPIPSPVARSHPADTGARPRTTQVVTPKPVERPASLTKVRVLLVEDDRDLSQKLIAELEKRFEVLPAHDGIEALERAANYKPDIFVVDGTIPKMTAYQLVTMLRRNRMFEKSPIVFISGKEGRDRQYVESLGVRYFLLKPFSMPALLEIIERAIAEPGFETRADRAAHEQVLMNVAMATDAQTTTQEALRVSNVLKADAQSRLPKKDDQEFWRH